MKPLEPNPSFIVQRYLNHLDNILTRLTHHFRNREEFHHSARLYYDLLAKNLEIFQRDVPSLQRAVLSLTTPDQDHLVFKSVYRQTPDFTSPELASVQLERFPDDAKSKSSSLGDPVILRKALAENTHLSLTCLLNPVLGLMEDLKKVGWVTTVDCRAGDTIMTVMTDRKVAVYIIVHLAEFEADTVSIKEYHSSKGTSDA